MHSVSATGRAEFEGEVFEFKIGDWANGIGLMVRRSGRESSIETGAGIWPSVEKAKSIANEMVHRAFNCECRIVWSQVPFDQSASPNNPAHRATGSA